jgi:hypothetical protein
MHGGTENGRRLLNLGERDSDLSSIIVDIKNKCTHKDNTQWPAARNENPSQLGALPTAKKKLQAIVKRH